MKDFQGNGNNIASHHIISFSLLFSSLFFSSLFFSFLFVRPISFSFFSSIYCSSTSLGRLNSIPSYIILFHTILSYIILYYIILSYIILYHLILSYLLSFHLVTSSNILNSTLRNLIFLNCSRTFL